MIQSQLRRSKPYTQTQPGKTLAAIAQEALRRARENEIHDPGFAAAIMKAALRAIAGER